MDTDMELFFHNESCVFSRIHRAPFLLGETHYTSVWQYYNYRKALTFEDETIAALVLENEDHRIQNQLVDTDILTKYTRTAWMLLCHQAIFDGYHAKFAQHPDLREQLFQTRDKLLVEVSHYESTWSSGLKYDDRDNYNVQCWLGGNWTGYILTQVREELLKELNQPSTFAVTWTWSTLRDDPKINSTVVERVWKNSVFDSFDIGVPKKWKWKASNTKNNKLKKKHRAI